MLLVYTMQKLSARKAALHETTAIPDIEEQTWRECLFPELMSSKESVNDGSFTTPPLPWRSGKATTRNGSQTPEETIQKSLVMMFQKRTFH